MNLTINGKISIYQFGKREKNNKDKLNEQVYKEWVLEIQKERKDTNQQLPVGVQCASSSPVAIDTGKAALSDTHLYAHIFFPFSHSLGNCYIIFIKFSLSLSPIFKYLDDDIFQIYNW